MFPGSWNIGGEGVGVERKSAHTLIFCIAGNRRMILDRTSSNIQDWKIERRIFLKELVFHALVLQKHELYEKKETAILCSVPVIFMFYLELSTGNQKST